MKSFLDNTKRTYLVAATFVLLHATSAMPQDCFNNEKKLHAGVVTPDPSAGTSTCSCGIVIKTGTKKCNKKQTEEPNHYLCDGPLSTVVDCIYDDSLPIYDRTYTCQEVTLGSVTFTIGGASITLGVCSGTYCKKTGETIIGWVPTASEVICPSGDF